MSKKSSHPELELFEYLRGNLDEKAAQAVNAHLSECDECTLMTSLVIKLKDSALAQDIKDSPIYHGSQTLVEHPDLSELASFFYQTSLPAERSSVAAHLALCSHCTEAVAQYARAEQIAAEYQASSAVPGTVSSVAWNLIHDWEESSFANVKPANEVLGEELLTRLAGILNEEQKRTVERETPTDNRVPVLIVSSKGDFRSVEFFEKEFDSTGESVLRHSEGSPRFNDKRLLTLFGLGGEGTFVVSSPILRDTVRLERAQNEEESVRTDFIIIED